MEGILEKYDAGTGGYFSYSGWNKYFFILHQEVLLIADMNDRAKIHGKLHMQISKVINDGVQEECEIRLHSGLVEVRLRASSIKEKVDWKNVLLSA